MFEYICKIAAVWFAGFFPAFEIFVAVPAGMLLGLDSFSVVFFSVMGNFTPVILLEYGYSWLMRYEWIRIRLNKPVPEKLRRHINIYGIWYILFATPWTGVWLMGIVAKALNMDRKKFIAGSFFSISGYAVVIVILINLGINFFSE